MERSVLYCSDDDTDTDTVPCIPNYPLVLIKQITSISGIPSCINMFGSPIASYHSDVLSATPNTKDERNRLIIELKNRAKVSIKSSNYMDASKLYLKGIEVYSIASIENNDEDTKDIAILFANKSMTEYQMKNYQLALDDAKKALEYDKAYIKAYYRKANALIALKDFDLASETLQDGLKLQPEEKELLGLLQKIPSLQEQYKNENKETKKVATQTTTTSYKSSEVNSSNNTSTTSKEKDTNQSNDIDDEDRINGVTRGYRITSDGRKTTFFHHELDDQTKELIGSIEPKKLEKTIDQNASISSNSSSAWNSAGTFEAKDFTKWSHNQLKQKFEEIIHENISSNDFFQITEVKNIIGDAQITMMRNKKKFIYDLSCDVILILNDSIEGNVKIEDITADNDPTIQISWKSTTGNGTGNGIGIVINKYITDKLKKVLLDFDVEFKSK